MSAAFSRKNSYGHKHSSYVWLKNDLKTSDLSKLEMILKDHLKLFKEVHSDSDSRNHVRVYGSPKLYVDFADEDNDNDFAFVEIDVKMQTCDDLADDPIIALKDANQKCDIIVRWSGSYYNNSMTETRLLYVLKALAEVGVMTWDAAPSKSVGSNEVRELGPTFKFTKPLTMGDLHGASVSAKVKLQELDQSHSKTVVKIVAFHGCGPELRVSISKDGNLYSSANKYLNIKLGYVYYQTTLSAHSDEKSFGDLRPVNIKYGDDVEHSSIIACENLTAHGIDWKNWEEEVAVLVEALADIGIVANFARGFASLARFLKVNALHYE